MQATEHPITIVHIGCGGVSRQWLAGIEDHPRANLVGIVDRDPEQLARTRERLGRPIACDSRVGPLIATTGACLVTNSSSPAAHHPTCTEALEAGAHVLCEKPFTETVAQAQELVALAARQKRLLGVCQNRRVCDDIQTVKGILDSGDLGALQALRCDFRRPHGGGGHRGSMPHVQLWDLGIHHLDQARFLADATAELVYADDWKPSDCALQHGPAVDLLVRFDNGVRCSYRGYYGGIEIPAHTTDYQARWTIYAERGVIDWHGHEIIVHTPAGSETVPPRSRCGNSAGGRAHLIDDMIQAITTGRQPEVPAADNIASIALIVAAIDSAESGQAVTP